MQGLFCEMKDGTNATLNVAFDATRNRRPSEADRGLVR